MAASPATAAVRSDPVARLIVLRHRQPAGPASEPDFLEYALSTAPLSRLVLDVLGGPAQCADDVGARRTIWAIPPEWRTALVGDVKGEVIPPDAADIDPEARRRIADNGWLVISNGRFATRLNRQRLEQGLADAGADAVAVTADPELSAYRERVRLTQDGQLVGYRRLYRDSTEPIPIPTDWPHHLYVRGRAALAILEGGLPHEFQDAIERIHASGSSVKSISVAGSSVDLGTEDGLLSLAAMALTGASRCSSHRPIRLPGRVSAGGNGGVSPQSRFVGPVLLGEHVSVEPDAVVIGPAILCDHSTVRTGALVDAAIVGAHAAVGRDQTVRRSVVAAEGSPIARRPTGGGIPYRSGGSGSRESAAFRSWPRFSYVGSVKRVADVIAAIVVLALFAPIIPFIALAIKISSSGPVFFRDKRQGLHGRLFKCVKFRTMRVGAHKLQEKLRAVSEVDGPQFKMVDDPRITTVGRFLRETYLDEIPQFYNVLVGDMSVVGPRPSPESENTLCPWWRDARLSIRPGITGLWQVCRTREPKRDFQEWIHYDTLYVRDLSWRLDLWICWRTFKRMAASFIDQF